MLFSPPHLADGARWAGMRVGLLGGSFNPPHSGHLHASLTALHSLMLDCVWWLVSPQNPLKPDAPMDFEERCRRCLELTKHHPRLIVSDLERQTGTNMTWETIRALITCFPGTDFVWITGMDNALTIHTWNNWTYILDHVATAHVARPPALRLVEGCPLKMRAQQNHVYLDKARKAPLLPRCTYWLMQKKLLEISSSVIRENQAIAVD